MEEDAQPNEQSQDAALMHADATRNLRSLEQSIMLQRYQLAQMSGITFDGARDEYYTLGYDRLVTARQYRDEYARGGIAGRIVDTMPNATWRGQVELIEDEDPDIITPFEQAWIDLDKKHQIQAKLNRADRLAGLSTYAVILIGAKGDLGTELTRGGPEALLYLTPFSGGGGPGANTQQSRMIGMDSDATIFEFETDAQSPRFGSPKSYQLRRVDISSPLLARPVHWTRVIHVAENLLDNEVYGLPRLERVWNLLADLRKVTGGGAEAFWLRANQGLHLDVDKDMALPSVKDTLEALKTQQEEYKHQLTRWLRTRGVKVETLGSDVANFQGPVDTILTQIAGATGIPKRILTGSEMGELASSQDRENFRDQVNGRQTGYAGPYILRPLVDRLIKYGYLPSPKAGPEAYEVRWAHIQTMTEQEKTAGATAWASVNSTYGQVVFTDAEIREKWADKPPLDEKQKQQIEDDAQKKAEQEGEASATKVEAVAKVTPKDQFGGKKDDKNGKKNPFLKAAESYPAIIVEESDVDELMDDELRALGDFPGHPFHGNQWTEGQMGPADAGGGGGAASNRDKFLARWPYHKEMDEYAKARGEQRLEQDLADFWTNQKGGYNVPSYEFQIEVIQKGGKRISSEKRAAKKEQKDANKPAILAQLKKKYDLEIDDEVFDSQTGTRGVVKWGTDGQPYVKSNMGKHYVGSRWQKSSRSAEEHLSLPPFMRAAQEAEEAKLVDLLTDAIACNATEVIEEICGVGDFHALGGEGSGNYDHEGRPGEVGGSQPQDGGRASKDRKPLTSKTLIWDADKKAWVNSSGEVVSSKDSVKTPRRDSVGSNALVWDAEHKEWLDAKGNKISEKLDRAEKEKSDKRDRDEQEQWTKPESGETHREFTGEDRARERKAAREKADEALTKAGFVRQTKAGVLGTKWTEREGVAEKRSTYKHPDGRRAVLTERWSKDDVKSRGEKKDSVSVHHGEAIRDLSDFEDDDFEDRDLGDFVGHPFHGNQWTEGQLGPVDAGGGGGSQATLPEDHADYSAAKGLASRMIENEFIDPSTIRMYKLKETDTKAFRRTIESHLATRGLKLEPKEKKTVVRNSRGGGSTGVIKGWVVKTLGDFEGHPFRGNQWTSGTGEASGGVASQTFPTKEIAKQAMKEAHKELVKAGFVRGTPERKHVASQKMGRSEAYSGSTDKARTIYTHPSGKTATLIEYYPKYHDQRVSIHHQRRPEGTVAE